MVSEKYYSLVWYILKLIIVIIVIQYIYNTTIQLQYTVSVQVILQTATADLKKRSRAFILNYIETAESNETRRCVKRV